MVERLGIPTASIIGSGFLKQAEVITKGVGVPLAIGVYPGAPMVDSEPNSGARSRKNWRPASCAASPAMRRPISTRKSSPRPARS